MAKSRSKAKERKSNEVCDIDVSGIDDLIDDYEEGKFGSVGSPTIEDDGYYSSNEVCAYLKKKKKWGRTRAQKFIADGVHSGRIIRRDRKIMRIDNRPHVISVWDFGGKLE